MRDNGEDKDNRIEKMKDINECRPGILRTNETGFN